MSQVRSLAYIGIGAADLEEWKEFGTSVLGLQVGDNQENEDLLPLRMDGRVYRIAVERGDPGALHYLGFEVETVAALDELADALRAKGVDVTDEADEVCAARRVAHMRSTTDPAGFRVELIVGHEEDTAPFVSPQGARFTIDDMGLGHAFLMTDDVDALLEFYMDGLGFRLSDTIGFGPGANGYFLHCNARHHTLACAGFPGMDASLGHLMLEVDSLDTVGHAYDVAVGAEVPIAMTLGKHTNDHMVSFYCAAPSGLMVEYGTQGRRVDDDTWVVGHYTAPSYWGHKPPEPAPAG